MALLTLLSVVNSYMDYTDGFRVASIDDTIESQQVASIAEKVFNDVVNDVFSTDLTSQIVQLESVADSEKPNYLRIPKEVIHVKESKVMYNMATGAAGASTLQMVEVPYKRPQEFLDTIGGRSTNQTNTIIVTDFSGYQMVIQNKSAPQFYTSFDDEFIVFDSYDSDVDTVLQTSKSGVMVTKQRSFSPSDTYIIDLPEWYHQGYLNEVISEASEVLREEPIFSVSRKARMAKIKARKKQRIGAKGIDTRRRRFGRG